MVNKEKLVEGAIFWCFLPDSESENYGRTKPQVTWQGKLRIEKHSCDTAYLLSRFNEETGEVDKDANSTSLLGQNPEVHLFDDKKEAQNAYLLAILKYLQEEAEKLSSEIQDALDNAKIILLP